MPKHYRYGPNRRYNRPYRRKFIPKRRQKAGRARKTFTNRPFIPKTVAMRPGSMGGSNSMRIKLNLATFLNKALPAAVSGVPVATNVVVVGLNSLFDTWGTPALTTQASGFDQFAALYNRYLVHSVKVTFQLQQTIAAGTQFRAIRLVIKPSTGSAVAVSNNPYEVEQKGVVVQYCPTDSGIVRGSYFYDMREIFQENPLEDGKGALVGASPAQNFYWQLVAFNGNGSTGTSVAGTIHFEFDVTFSQRKTVIDVP